ncbi:MAG: TlpA disulfide reductase family protein [Granulosicoccaceae bacterium]|jgi:peroxiredoxin
MQRKDFTIAIAGLLVLALAIGVWLAPTGLGQAPSVTLTTLEGERIELDSLRGRPVLVTFWATSCATCIEEIPDLLALHEQFADQGLMIIGVAMSYDPPNLVKTFTERRALPYTIALDLDGSVAQAFDEVRVTPTNFLIDPDGRVVKKKLGLMDMTALRNQIAAMLARS